MQKKKPERERVMTTLDSDVAHGMRKIAAQRGLSLSDVLRMCAMQGYLREVEYMRQMKKAGKAGQ